MKIYILLFFTFLPNFVFSQNNNSNPDNNPEPLDLSGFIDTTSFFPGRGAFGIEISPTYQFGGTFRMEYGFNFVYTSWVNLEQNMKDDVLLNKNWGLQQWGPSINFSRITVADASGEIIEDWSAKLGITYNRINVPFYSLGFTSRIKAVTVFPQGEASFFDFDNLYLQPEIGITWMSIFNIYYSRNVPLNGPIGSIIPTHSIKFTLNINASFFNFGLQGL